MPVRYLLDTNIISDLVRNPHGRCASRVRAMPNEKLATSIVVAAELRYGCAKKGSQKLLRQVKAVLSGLEILPLDVPADREYGDLRTRLETIGEPIGYNDLLIAAQALASGLIVVTDNEREFTKVGGLSVENWLR
jgi:tRNA(fMet)-specific endonuclease VapC